MQSSYGETDIVHSSRHIGRIRLKSVSALPALGPRLGFSLGFQLHDQAEHPSGREAIVDYRLTDLNGDVRLKESGPYVGSLEWSGRRGHVRSSNYGHEDDLQLICELDWQRLEALERHRTGKQLELWFSLWPRLENRGLLLEVDVRPLRAQLPLEAWIPVLENLRHARIEVLEVAIPAAFADQFRACLAELSEARRQVDFGEYASAIVRCRKAAEMLAKLARRKDSEADGVKEVLEAFVGAERAAVYTDVLREVKKLGNVELHAVVEHGYSRSEALFAIRTLESLTELFGSILTGSGRA